MSETVLKFGDRAKNQDRRVSDGPGPIERSAMDRRQADLTWIPLFSHAVSEDVNYALRNCDILELPADQALLVPGQYNEKVYIALTGELAAHLDYELAGFDPGHHRYGCPNFADTAGHFLGRLAGHAPRCRQPADHVKYPRAAYQ